MSHFPFRRWFLAVAVALAIGIEAGSARCGWAADAPAAGHSAHGETFSQGPRSAAYLMNAGDIHFPLTCKSEKARAFFNQGIGQFHGFWYYEAERSFRTAAALDPSCVMAYWGMAIANVHNAGRGRDFIREAVKRKDSARLNPIELAWIGATEEYYRPLPPGAGDSKKSVKTLIATLKQMNEKFPDDIEIKAFLCYFIMENTAKEDFSIADKLLNEIFAITPGHPARHYRMHMGEGPGHAKSALISAAQIGPGAPALPHMWHMPGMSYGGYGRLFDAVWSCEAADRVQHTYTIRSGMMPFQDSWSTHYDEFLITNLISVGRVHDAINLATSMVDLPRPQSGNGEAPAGMERLIDTLSQYQMWDEYLAMCASGYLTDELEFDQLLRKQRYEGVANAARGHAEAADAIVARLEAKRAKLQTPATQPAGATTSAVASTAPSTRPSTAKLSPAAKLLADRLAAIDQAISHINAQKALSAGDYTKAVPLLTATNVRKEHIAIACLTAGDFATAERVARQASGGLPYPLATQVLVFHRIGKKADAAKAFASLRAISDGIDLTVEPFKSVSAIAPEYGFNADYRMPRKIAEDAAQWPALDSLGPFLWHPAPAPPWSAPAANGASLSLSQYRGKPVILLFYLGHGCPHCVRQIHEFGMAAKQFTAAGISLLAVGTDSPDVLHETWKMAKIAEDPLTFPLASDASMAIFKAYRCYDDFENMPLHGTFLIDGQGNIRWQDIGPEPFMNTTFLLKESQRLLGQNMVSHFGNAK